MNIRKLNDGSNLNLDHITRSQVRDRRFLDGGPGTEATYYDVPRHLWLKLLTGEVLA